MIYIYALIVVAAFVLGFVINGLIDLNDERKFREETVEYWKKKATNYRELYKEEYNRSQVTTTEFKMAA